MIVGVPLLRAIAVAAALAAAVIAVGAVGACGGGQKTEGDDEPTTAAEKQRREVKPKGDTGGGKWGGWRYQGERDDCFFVVGRKCFKSEKSACSAARCKTPAACKITGGGPASVSCDRAIADSK